MYPHLLLPAGAACAAPAAAAGAVAPPDASSELPTVAPLLLPVPSLLLHAALLLLAPPLVLVPEDLVSAGTVTGCSTCQAGRACCSDSSLSADLKGPEQEGQGMPLARSTSAVHLCLQVTHTFQHTHMGMSTCVDFCVPQSNVYWRNLAGLCFQLTSSSLTDQQKLDAFMPVAFETHSIMQGPASSQ